MKKQIDINCDLGEGMENDEAIMSFISSANIACGYHAGNEETITRTIRLCLQYNVAIGAHPSFDDKHNFGRTEMVLDDNALSDLITIQINKIDEAARKGGGKMTHVKPHGALYNMAARDQHMASVIANAVHAYNPQLVLYGLSGSYLVSESKRIGLNAVNEVFADRTYQDNGQLTPRSQSNSLIENVRDLKKHVLSMVVEGKVISTSGKQIPIDVDTICIHGDHPKAPEFAKALHGLLTEEGIAIMPL